MNYPLSAKTTALLTALSLPAAGCSGGSAFVVGNFTSMAIVLVMLWSTLNISGD